MRITVVFEFSDIDDVESIEAQEIIDSIERDCAILAGPSNSAWIEAVTEEI